MIARLWRGATPADQADDYERYVEETGIRAYRATPGNRGAWERSSIRGTTIS
jgi:hypothetical protein